MKGITNWDSWVYPDSNPKPLNAPNQQAKLADIRDLQDKQQLTHQSWGFNGNDIFSTMGTVRMVWVLSLLFEFQKLLASPVA